MARDVAFLLGKAPRPGTIIAEVLGLLERAGARVRVHLPHDEDLLVEDLLDADLVVHRGLSRTASRMLPLLADEGVPLCNPGAGTSVLADRATLHRALEEAGLPTPRATSQGTWAEVLAGAARRAVVVKAASGAGRGHGVLTTPLPDEAPLDGPYLVEERIPHDGTDRKLYVAGDRVRGLLKPSTLLHEHTTRGQPFAVPEELAGLALETARALDLHLLGVDVVLGEDGIGPVVVDVNAFPGYRGVSGAAQDVADHLLAHVA